MTAPLPDMPPRIGDPGVFVCSRRDLEPWTATERPPAASLAPAAGPGVWLVLALCRHCNYATRRYCSSHDVRPRRP